jgi:hypothetical protein
MLFPTIQLAPARRYSIGSFENDTFVSRRQGAAQLKIICRRLSRLLKCGTECRSRASAGMESDRLGGAQTDQAHRQACWGWGLEIATPPTISGGPLALGAQWQACRWCVWPTSWGMRAHRPLRSTTCISARRITLRRWKKWPPVCTSYRISYPQKKTPRKSLWRERLG